MVREENEGKRQILKEEQDMIIVNTHQLRARAIIILPTKKGNALITSGYRILSHCITTWEQG